MKKVLLVSFYFPPYGDIAGIRASKFCKFLPEFGWEPWVLTIDKRYYGQKTTDTTPKELEFTRVTRLPYLPIPFAKTFASLAYPLFMLFFILKNKNQLDAIHMIGSPYHPFLLTPIITKLFNLPVSLDFRDSWSHNFGFNGRGIDEATLYDKIRCYISYCIEKIAVKNSSFVTFATSVLQDEYIELLRQDKEKFHTIFNGYDQEDFINISPISLTEKKTIILTGKFHEYTPNAAKLFLKIIGELSNFTFIYIGNEHETIQSIAQNLQAENNVITMKYQPYKRALQFISGSNFCLLSNGLVNGMGTKIFDYLALAKPTLCLVPEESIISRQFAEVPGIIILEAPHSKESIKKGLQKLLEFQSCSLSKIIMDKFTRRNAGKHLAFLLDKAVLASRQDETSS